MPLPPPNSALKSAPNPARKNDSPDAKQAPRGLHTDMGGVLQRAMRSEEAGAGERIGVKELR